MTDLEIAKEMERAIMGDRWILPCDCKVIVFARFPIKPWIWASGYDQVCPYHRGLEASRKKNGHLPRKLARHLAKERNRRLCHWITEQGLVLDKAALKAGVHEVSQNPDWRAVISGTESPEDGVYTRDRRNAIRPNGTFAAPPKIAHYEMIYQATQSVLQL